MSARKWLWIVFGLIDICGCRNKSKSYREEPLSSCYEIQDRKTFVVFWEALKSNGQKVKGQITGKGTMEPGPDGGLDQGLFELEFDIFSMDSHIALRNERIWNYFLKADAFPAIEFKGLVTAEDKSFPAIGEKRKIKIEGPLSLAGQVITLTLHAEVINEAGVIYVQESRDEKSIFDVRSTSVLSTNIDQMLHTAKVDGMDQNVILSGIIPLIQPCSG